MSKPQRYQLVHEFELRDKGDYGAVATLFRRAVEDVAEVIGSGRMVPNGFSITKVQK